MSQVGLRTALEYPRLRPLLVPGSFLIDSEYFFNLLRRAVASPYPNYIWREAEQDAQIRKISVLRDHYEVVLLCVLPDSRVIGRS
jgi:hypothetical protein